MKTETYQPRLVAYANANGRTPHEQVAHDKRSYPAAGPLPWLARETVNGLSAIEAGDGRQVANTNYYLSPKHARANAELIVRAVNNHADLLKALASLHTQAANLAETFKHTIPMDAAFKASLTKARAAIAAATGGQP